MSISQTQAEAIKHMIENDPALCERLRGITEFDELTSELAAAARVASVAAAAVVGVVSTVTPIIHNALRQR